MDVCAPRVGVDLLVGKRKRRRGEMRLHSVDVRREAMFRGDACKSELPKALDGEAWRALPPRG